ncbi:TPA: hypothetical protein PTV74_003207 [Clostridium botulinum]|nr:hypothetical protein [Clostridium botulinum]HDK7206362.1 hypothetical protein [Clostridium botulinum]HDK7210098.1 hypothetical protein [Clostridium botulinum]HDK7265547.1 hypothetical protein [Clostridium botulinum]HDK7269395.1 hypothetical protein [Clostridium botulinum]
MSSSYYIGTFKDNIINRPIEITGITQNCIEDILEYCGISVYEDFNYFNSDRNLLFYKTTKENRDIIPNPFIDDDFYKEEIGYNEFPVVCNGKILENGNSYHMSKVDITLPNYKNFRKTELTMELVDNVLKDYSGWINNRDEQFFNEINKIYKIITMWIENNELIYWWRYI